MIRLMSPNRQKCQENLERIHIEVLLDKSGYPKRLTYDKINVPKQTKVSRELGAYTPKTVLKA